ncbi:DUF6660 family protein [Emticicia aquatilis]|uniref:DUF6660 family protein n=1 Tax=Emticicia aquatilis TaxID=1537369 RepID=UPI001E583DFD|nr:DUF6660 family protein [Emticicia aquatilis]
MKAFSIILSIYLLVLSCLPCGDVEDCKVVDNEKIAFSETNHSTHQEDTETCSPFCICACCGTNIVLNFSFSPLISVIEPNFLSEKVTVNFYNTSFISDFYGNIWQPPKI